MNARRRILLVATVLLITGCGDGEGSEATVATTAPPVATEPSPTTTVATTTTVMTTTTMATTTTTSPTTTTVPPGMHAEAGFFWGELLPDPETRAVYRVDMVTPDTPMSHQWGVAGDLEARMEYGVDWFGREGSYIRLVLGLDPSDTPGVVFYFQVEEPWVIAFFGMEAWEYGNLGRGPSALEAFAEPATIDLSGESGETFTFNGTVTALDSFGVEDLDASVAVTLRNSDAGTVTVAAGTFERAMVYEILLYGPIVGGPDFPIEVTISPGNLILKMSMPGAEIELLEPWG